MSWHSEIMTAPFRPTPADIAQRKAFEGLLALPESLRRTLAGKPHVVDGGALDPDIALGLRLLDKIAGDELDERTIDDARHALAAESWMFAGSPAHVQSIQTMSIPVDGGVIEALLYRPVPQPVEVAGKHRGPEDEGQRRPLACVVYFHGGGWVLGSHHTHDAVARALCAGAEVAVLNVDYRLAPEHPFPTAVDDAVAAFTWVHDHAASLGIDPDRIAVAGDSAGGNLAAVVSQITTRAGGPKPAFQALFVPVVDMTMPRTRSYELFSEGYFLTRANMDWYEANYLGGSAQTPPNLDELRADPRVSPLRATDLPELATAGLPPAYVAVAGFDPLRDEGIAYARTLREAGTPTTLRIHTDAVHPFINILATSLGRRCMAEAVGALRVGLSV